MLKITGINGFSLQAAGSDYTDRTAQGEAAAESSDQSQEKSDIQRETLDKNAFFKLLITQLKYQDPLKPMENTEFISQMAQFSSLEQMQNMNESMDQFLKVQGLSEGASLIGKNIETYATDDNEALKGKVVKVTFADGKIFAHTEEGAKINIDEIKAIS